MLEYNGYSDLRKSGLAGNIYTVEQGFDGFHFRGGALALLKSRHHEIILGGPYGTGKSFAGELKFYLQAWKYPNSRCIMLRKELRALMTSGYLTLRDKIIKNPLQPYPLGHPKCPVMAHGGITSPDHLVLPNGSEIYFRGLDDSTKVLSAEYDFAYVCQAEELELEDWLQLLGRCTGRAGNAPYAQVSGDCNPSSPNHWILNRDIRKGGSLLLLEQLHHHNPDLCDLNEDDVENSDYWDWTARGDEELRILDSYSGVLYQKARLGKWVSPQGIVFPNFQKEIHVIDGRGMKFPKEWMRFRSIDFGFNHPFVCQWWVVDEAGTMYMYREMYMTKRLIAEHAEEIDRLSEGENIVFTVCDHDAEDIEVLKRHGIWSEPAHKDVRMNIELLEERLRLDSNGNAGIYFLSNALVEEDKELRKLYHPRCTVDSMINLTYPSKLTGTPKDEIPVRRFDDGFHATAYAVAAMDSQARKARQLHYGKVRVPTSDPEGNRRRRRKDRERGALR